MCPGPRPVRQAPSREVLRPREDDIRVTISDSVRARACVCVPIAGSLKSRECAYPWMDNDWINRGSHGRARAVVNSPCHRVHHADSDGVLHECLLCDTRGEGIRASMDVIHGEHS